MNVYLISLVSKWVSIVLVSSVSLFSNINFQEKVYVNQAKYNVSDSNIVAEVLKYGTVTKYVTNRPIGIAYTVTQGKDGYAYVDKVTGNQVVIENKVDEVTEVGIGEVGEYTGTLTGYGADCPGCSSVGNVSCRTYNGSKHSLINDGSNYFDHEYGSVRILAAELSKFPCGTIIYVNNGIMKPFYGIVLDTGYTMRQAYSQGKIWIDLAFSAQSSAFNAGVTSANTRYSVIRWGW